MPSTACLNVISTEKKIYIYGINAPLSFERINEKPTNNPKHYINSMLCRLSSQKKKVLLELSFLYPINWLPITRAFFDTFSSMTYDLKSFQKFWTFWTNCSWYQKAPQTDNKLIYIESKNILTVRVLVV